MMNEIVFESHAFKWWLVKVVWI